MLAAATDGKPQTLPAIMKTILQIITLIYSIGSFACDCDEPKITEKYIQSDFVAKVTITKIYPNEKGSNSYRADIKIDELFKGETITHIFVYGRSDGGLGTSCDIFIHEKTKLVVYAWKNKVGKYGVGMCSGLLYLNYPNSNVKNRELEILKLFKSKKINFTDKTRYSETGTLQKKLNDYKGISLEKEFGIYEITFSSDLTIKEVKEICGFGGSIDYNLIQMLKETKWSSYNSEVKNKVSENSKLLVGFYFYKAEKGNLSFLSNYYL